MTPVTGDMVGSQSHLCKAAHRHKRTGRGLLLLPLLVLLACSFYADLVPCEVAIRETPALTMADKKPKEEVKTENNDHINLKVEGQDGSVVQFKIKRPWCTGKTQRNLVEREVGGGIGMGNTCKSMADSCQCMTKTTTIL